MKGFTQFLVYASPSHAACFTNETKQVLPSKQVLPCCKLQPIFMEPESIIGHTWNEGNANNSNQLWWVYMFLYSCNQVILTFHIIKTMKSLFANYGGKHYSKKHFQYQAENRQLSLNPIIQYSSVLHRNHINHFPVRKTTVTYCRNFYRNLPLLGRRWKIVGC